MSTSLSNAAARVSVALLTLLPMWASAAVVDPCGVPGAPPCDVPEPGTWPLVGLALVVAIVVARRSRK